MLGNHDRHRIASRLGQDQVRIAAVLLLTLRGTPTLYYGDELGLPDVEVDEERIQDPVGRRTGRPELGRDPARMPMPWTREPGHGFSLGEVELWLPLRPDSAAFSIAAQGEDPDSVLSLYRRLLRLRRSEPALAVGSCAMIEADDRALCFLREHDAGDAFVALNFTDQTVPLRLPDHRSWDLALTTRFRSLRATPSAARGPDPARPAECDSVSHPEIRAIPLFADMSDDACRLVSVRTGTTEVAAGTILAIEGSSCDPLHIVETGRVTALPDLAGRTPGTGPGPTTRPSSSTRRPPWPGASICTPGSR